jgi:SAP domain-containing protein
MALSRRMSLQAFENGYWYQTELVEFGKKLGLPAAHRMRKNELESAITSYLATGRLPKTTSSKPLKKGLKDLDKGLALDLPIANYTSNRVTKGFIRREAERKNPGIKEKSGVWYRLNRWREANVAKRTVTYGELIDQYIALNSLERFEQIPHPRYVNFLADYFAAEKDASRKDAIAAWKKLKRMDMPKNYKAWRAFIHRKRRGSNI